MREAVREAVAQGATLLTGGERAGTLVRPTLLAEALGGARDSVTRCTACGFFSESEMCGNGLRCVARWLADRGLTWDMIAAELDRRHGTSGHTEKAGRPQ